MKGGYEKYEGSGNYTGAVCLNEASCQTAEVNLRQTDAGLGVPAGEKGEKVG